MREATCIGLGSNLGDREENLSHALNNLEGLGRVVFASSVYETAPWNTPGTQNMYLNMAAILETALTPYELLRGLLDIEVHRGRPPNTKNQPRCIDLDLLMYGDTVISDEAGGLIVPHPLMHLRPFVLVPLAEVAPDFIHPVLHFTITELSVRMDNSDVILRR